MNKFLLVCVLLMGFVWADSIGYIDSQQILRQYNKAVAAQADLVKKQKEFQEKLAEKQKQLEQDKVESKSEEEIQKIKVALEEELMPMKEELLQLNQKLSTEIEKEIIDTTKTVAKQLRIDVVLDKQVVFVGGIDLTSMVISKLNNQ